MTRREKGSAHVIEHALEEYVKAARAFATPDAITQHEEKLRLEGDQAFDDCKVHI